MRYAAFAERELVQRQQFAVMQRVLGDMPYDELRRRRDFLTEWLEWGSNQERCRAVIPYYNAEIARRHHVATDPQGHESYS